MRARLEPPEQIIHARRTGLADGATGFRVWPDRVESQTFWPEHEHVDHELVVVTAGLFTLEIGGILWMVPPMLAIWIPACVRHSATAAPGTAYTCAYVRPERSAVLWLRPTLVASSPMLLATLAYLAQDAIELGARGRAEAVFYDLLAPVSASALELPMPRDDRARNVAESLLRDPSDERHLEDWGRCVGASARTLQRLFAAQTGISFERWRTQARIRAALVYLAQGLTVGEVSRRLGYRSSSAFVTRFTSVIGVTPGQYVARQDGVFAASIVG